MNLAMAKKPDKGIPPFLVVTREEQERRQEWNRTHPLQHSSFTEVARAAAPIDEAAEAMLREIEKGNTDAVAERNKRLANNNKKPKVRVERAAPTLEIPEGYRWDVSRSKLVPMDELSPTNYARLLREMPTEAHRAAFVKLYGPGQSGAAAAPVTKAAKTSATRPAVPAASQAVKGPRLSKDEQTAKVAALLERPEGASLTEISKEMGWLEHSASAFLSTAFRAKGRPTTKETISGRGTVYRIAKAH